MDDILYDAWTNGGNVGSNLQDTKSPNRKIITANNAVIDNISFSPNEIGTMYVAFNFLTDSLTNKSEFTYHVIQRDVVTNEIIGGETYVINRPAKETFNANAGDDGEINKNESITLSAKEINGLATYNWYHMDGNLIYTGKDLSVAPEVTEQYKLEIINIDGYKDYDLVQVIVNPFSIESIVPNPASTQIDVDYMAQDASSAYLMIVNIDNGTSNNYILDTQLTNTSIDVSSFSSGLYEVVLVCDGLVMDSDTLIKN